MRHFWIAAILLATSVLSSAQLTPPPIEQLIKDVAYNELHDRERDSFWQYCIQQRIGSQRYTKYQVETEQGPIYRILEKDGHRLTPEQEREEENRLNSLMNSPSALAKNRDDHLQDEARLQRLVMLMADGFIYEPGGPPSGDLLTLKFSPNPAFKPPTYEARVFHGMAGTMVVDQRLKRFVAMHGTLINRIDFGYGLLGYVDKGGRFDIHREQVSDTRWKTNLVDIHVSGRVILFKSVSKDHYEARSQFQPVETTISLPETRRLLDQAASENQASLSPGQKF
ncbi:MAG TPA: hypothetical protein VHT24_06175 [Pseudacidobacterium sp.]|jgi:hypothetical protein|nr:hypothetical protein [Pseudacidobacterium sp.]